jgi:DNA-directed RNA polymerase sigma subunit (sigma70/sigma32)
VKEYTAQFKDVNNRTPAVPEIAHALGATQFDISKVMSMQTYPTLLCTPMKSGKALAEGKERTFEDMIPSVYKAPIAQSDSKDLRREMESMMQTNLNEVERDVLRLRLGLDDGRAKAVKEVGKRFKISWKQVRSVEKEALSKLLDSQEISDFVDSYHRV